MIHQSRDVNHIYKAGIINILSEYTFNNLNTLLKHYVINWFKKCLNGGNLQ